jgi:hypothetical protein
MKKIMSYYCESYSESVNHVTPSILMLDNEFTKTKVKN